MKKNILLIIGLLFLSSCAGKIQINQEFKGSGKGLFIVLSHIKQDKKIKSGKVRIVLLKRLSNAFVTEKFEQLNFSRAIKQHLQ